MHTPIFPPKSRLGQLTAPLAARPLLTLLVIAALARVVILVAFLPTVFAFEQTGAVHGSDAYDAYAQNLLATGVYGRTPGEADAMIPPLYSYVLAGVYALFGRGGLQVGLFHTALDLISITLLVLIGRRLFPQQPGVAWLAGLFTALYPYLIFQNLTLIDTPLFIVFLHSFVYVMILLREREALDRGTWLLAALGGVILGLGILNRPILPPLAVLVAVWFLFRLSFWQTVARLLPVAVVGVLVVVPWMARNYGVFDTVVAMTTTSGSNFWQGNSPYVVPYFRAGYDVQWTSPEGFDDSGMTAPEADAALFDMAITYLRENPEDWFALYSTKFLVHWSIDIAPRYNPTTGAAPRLDYHGNPIIEEDDAGAMQLSGLPENDPVNAYSEPLFDQIGRWVHRFYFGGMLLLAMAGVVVTRRRWRMVSLLWFVQIGMTLVYVIYHPSTRYRVPSDPLLFLFSAAAVAALIAWWRSSPGLSRSADKA